MAGTVREIVLDSKGWRYGMVIEDLARSSTVTGWHVEQTVSKDSRVFEGQVIAVVADLGTNTHLHVGFRPAPYSSMASRGALPQASCGGDAAFREQLIDPEQVPYR